MCMMPIGQDLEHAVRLLLCDFLGAQRPRDCRGFPAQRQRCCQRQPGWHSASLRLGPLPQLPHHDLTPPCAVCVPGCGPCRRGETLHTWANPSHMDQPFRHGQTPLQCSSDLDSMLMITTPVATSLQSNAHLHCDAPPVRSNSTWCLAFAAARFTCGMLECNRPDVVLWLICIVNTCTKRLLCR